MTTCEAFHNKDTDRYDLTAWTWLKTSDRQWFLMWAKEAIKRLAEITAFVADSF